MTLLDVKEIKSTISQIPFVTELLISEQQETLISGQVTVQFEGLEHELCFEFKIFAPYPLRTYESESIKFINKNFVNFSHVMADGSICIHTSHSTNLKQKLSIDFNSLKNWIERYYINRESDSHYEHIITAESLDKDLAAYFFTDLDIDFKRGDYGTVKCTKLHSGTYKEQDVSNYIVQSFVSIDSNETRSKWTGPYSNLPITQTGIYVFIETPPARHDRFAFTNWREFEEFFSSKFVSFLHKFELYNLKNLSGRLVPIFIGYNTPTGDPHWLIAILEIGKFPTELVNENETANEEGKQIVQLADSEIIWALSRNSSYRHFFGRGAFCDDITKKRILILGIGAIGSMVATTLVRCGSITVDLADFDIKEPENVCRSEYLFNLGINNKVDELTRILHRISPFVEIKQVNRNYFETLIKALHQDSGAKVSFEQALNKYDIIFDCTTDSDLMWVLSSLELTCDVINLSITNHAKELVCAFSPNIYEFVNNQFAYVLKNDLDDLFNPTGCWSPTFKASYNDINTLVQLALKHINILYDSDRPKNNFVINWDDSNAQVINLRILEY